MISEPAIGPCFWLVRMGCEAMRVGCSGRTSIPAMLLVSLVCLARRPSPVAYCSRPVGIGVSVSLDRSTAFE